ncbi:MAG TPA: hypothetical protein VK578_10380 [Edaphobacter sp.]|nr:hypothetical protein [Edaphobacter sp.]
MRKTIKAWAVIEADGHIVADSNIGSTLIDQIAGEHADNEIIEVEILIPTPKKRAKKK